MNNATKLTRHRLAIDQCPYDDTNFIDWSHLLIVALKYERREYVLELDPPNFLEDSDSLYHKRRNMKFWDDLNETKFLMLFCIKDKFRNRFEQYAPKDVYEEMRFDFEQKLKSEYFEIFCKLLNLNYQDSHMYNMTKLIVLLQYSGIFISGVLEKKIIDGTYPEDSPGVVSNHDPAKAEFALYLLRKSPIDE
ncbi:hypothetical protein LIER_35559 [Lithospermum erythrorhizon]|uniref:Uncharacterized protein n=1 Tax=Lithospermum erythrorhizon TaxID=34254 RepID=A0AAV3NTN4_LITER